MTIKTIIELQSKPGKRSELVHTMDGVIATMREVPCFRGTARYEVLEDPDKLIEVTEWELPQARQIWLDRIIESGGLEPLMEVLGAPFKATNVRQID